MDMRKWLSGIIATERKKALPVLSFPAVQLMGISVRDLIGSSDCQAEAMRLVAQRYPTAAAVSFMDLSVEAEAFGAETVVSDDEVPTVVGALVDEDTDPSGIVVPAVGVGRTGLYVEAIRQGGSLDRRPPGARRCHRPVLAGRAAHGRVRGHGDVLRGTRARACRAREGRRVRGRLRGRLPRGGRRRRGFGRAACGPAVARISPRSSPRPTCAAS